MKLLHVASSHLIGLTNQKTQLALAYKLLDDLEFTVLSGENEQVSGLFTTLKDNNIPFKVINGFDIHNDFWRLIKEFADIVKQEKPDIISVNTNWQLVVAGLTRTIFREKYKILYTIHGFRHNHAFKSIIARYLIMTILFLFADAINAPSKYVRNKFLLLKRKIKSIPLGEDDLFFSKRVIPDFSQPLYFCFPGEFRSGKNQQMLIEAFATYIDQTKNVNAKLFLPGDGELLSDIKSIAKQLDIQDQVVFPGQLNRQEMVDMYLQCQISLVSSNTETFGHCIAEPLILKRIVISRPVGIASDFIEHGVNGFLFNNKDELVKLMVHVSLLDIKDLTEISKHAGEIGENFSWDSVAKKNVEKLMWPLINKVGE